MRPYRAKDVPEVLKQASVEQMARWLDVHITTVRRWRRYGDPPRAALDMITLRTTGDLGIIDTSWGGWTLHNGRLAAPGGGDFDFSPGDVMSLPFKQQLIKHLQQQMMLPTQADWITRDYRPNEIEAEALEQRA